MLFQPTLYFGLLSLTACISAVIALIAWRRRSASIASPPFIGLMVAITGYALAASLEAGAVKLSNKIFWSTLEYVGSGGVIAFFVLFAASFTNRKRWLSVRNRLLLWLIPAMNVGLVATNHWHGWIWTDFLPGPPGSNSIIYEHGPAFYWVMAWVYLYSLIGTVLLVQAALHHSTLLRRQSALALVGAFIPIVGSSAYMLDLTPAGLNVAPMSFLLTGLVYFTNLFRFQMLDLVPVARDALIEGMSDGVLVLDGHNRILDVNPAARTLLGIASGWVGRSIYQALPEWRTIDHLCQGYGQSTAEVFIDAKTPRYLEFRVTPLGGKDQRLVGHLIMVRDVTQQCTVEMELQQANHSLQQQLSEIEQLQTQLQEQATRDGLTGLFNRRYFEETLSREIARAARGGYSVAVLLLDIDYFKRINDSFGHLGGDRVLQTFGNLLKQSCRLSDVACRYGGEEFVMVLPGMSLQSAYERAEQIRHAFESISTLTEAGAISATVSGGVGTFPEHGRSSYEVLQAVDRSLYRAKAAGRNQIQVAS